MVLVRHAGTYQFSGHRRSKRSSTSSAVSVSTTAVERRLGITQQLNGLVASLAHSYLNEFISFTPVCLFVCLSISGVVDGFRFFRTRNNLACNKDAALRCKSTGEAAKEH